MKKKIFQSILNVTVVILFVSLMLITGVLHNYFQKIQNQQLKEELTLAALGVEQRGISYLSGLGKQNNRITWIASDGDILFDNQADITKMENHSDREEFIEAIETGVGSSLRHSYTLTKNTFYEAKLLSDGSVLRISMYQKSVLALLWGLIQPFGIILILAIVVAYFIAERIAKQIMEPLDEIDLEHPLREESYEELAPFLKRIHYQKKQIRWQLEELNQKKLEFEQVISHMKEGLVLLDAKDQIISINPAAMELFQTTLECIGNDFLSVERKQKLTQTIEKAREEGWGQVRIEKNNREYQFDVTSIHTEKGIIGSVILAFDITEQRNAEKMRREFSANVSHELKTPLQSIIGSAELLQNNLVKNEDVPRFIGHIHTEASRLVVLIEDVIRLSELDEEQKMEKDEISLYQITAEVLESLKDKATIRKIRLNLEGNEGRMTGVYRLLYEVVYNLCENAIKYNVDGGNVSVTIKETEKEAGIIVEDTGIGIPVEHQNRVFERFYRVDKSHSKKSGGTGLGLSIVKHAVSYHNGTIELTSEEGNGTKVEILFPKS
ncbi:MAG: PAS domain-containing protein [Lachnospiraceae bacterium]|nr:PAS domain-containing protein [Lachnospiraceae bacterium]